MPERRAQGRRGAIPAAAPDSKGGREGEREIGKGVRQRETKKNGWREGVSTVAAASNGSAGAVPIMSDLQWLQYE